MLRLELHGWIRVGLTTSDTVLMRWWLIPILLDMGLL